MTSAPVKRSEHPGDLRAAMQAAMRPAAAANKNSIIMRPVEQGARLVTTPKGDVTTILQMQRGNLEGVAPRLLVLTAIVEHLNEGQYAEAWELAGTHRVDLNLIVDYAWPRFAQDAGKFVQVRMSTMPVADVVSSSISTSLQM